LEHTDYINEIAASFIEYCEKSGLESSAAQSQLMRSLFDSIASLSAQNIREELVYIKSENAVIEVIDKETGGLFRRYLELTFDENNNGLRLLGEDMSGKESQIVFLSNSSIEKMSELRGRGPDKPRCD